MLDFIEGLNKSEKTRFISMFRSILAYSPRICIERHFQNMQIPCDIDIFTYALLYTEILDTQHDELSDFAELSNRLETIYTLRAQTQSARS